jgi:hypothetical protein
MWAKDPKNNFKGNMAYRHLESDLFLPTIIEIRITIVK